MTLKECYAALEGSYDEMMARLMTEERIKKFLVMFLKDPTFDELCEAMTAEDYETAFRGAHTMKGLCLNLGIDKLRRSSEELTEALRHNQITDAVALLPQVIADYSLTVETIKQLD